jgi:hypothetical protein
MEKLIKMIKDLMASKFWGLIEVKFEDGKIVHLRKTENIKP